MDPNVNVLDWFWEIPVVTRAYFSASLGVTALCALDVVSPYHLYFNPRQIARGEFWRLGSNFLFFGQFGLDFIFHMYFFVRYCRSLEESSFRGRPVDFLYMLLLGATMILALSPFSKMMFYGSSLTFMLVYLWSRRNPGMQISLLGLVAFQAPYLPWVFLTFSLLLGHDVTADLLGIAAGHTYYYFADVWPALADARGWRWKHPAATPWLMRRLFGVVDAPAAAGGLIIDIRNAVQPQPVPQPQQAAPQPQPGVAAGDGGAHAAGN